MSEELIVSHCSPTMAGLKTGNLFACPMEDREELNASLRRLNLRLVPRGVRMIPVRYSDDNALIYMYRPEKLREDLSDPLASSILSERSYPDGSCERCVAELARRLNAADEFPHEIGLFLGYPSHDVDGFIRCGAREAKCVGAWRVYGDEEAAKKKFSLYKKCKRVYLDSLRSYKSFDRLIVGGRRQSGAAEC